MNLFFRKSGDGDPLIILHGLFGSSDNWYTLAKTFATRYTVYLVDQRNHGQSPGADDFNYQNLTDDLHNFMYQQSLKSAHIIGHSMGGKTAMNFAVAHPTMVNKLIVVDIVPKGYPVHHDAILDGLKAIPLGTLSGRQEADRILSTYVPEEEVRQFLLKNLVRKPEGGFGWKINLPAIEANIEEIGAGMVHEGTYPGPSLFIMGESSSYFVKGDESIINRYFPKNRLVFLPTGHWVQAEKPAEFAQLAMDFLS